MKKQLLRLLPVAAVLLTASCTDDQYDISNVDTESRFTAKGLVIPLNMSPIMLDNIISIEKNGDIKKDDEGNYYFQKDGTFQSEIVKADEIKITKPNDISQSVTVTVALSTTIQNNWKTYAPGMTIKQIKEAGLSSAVGIDDDTQIFSVTINASSTTFNMNAENIDSKITIINKLGLDPLPMNLDIRLGALNNVVNKVNISNLTVDLPSGMTIQEANVYNPSDGKLKYNALEVLVGTPKTIATVTGLDCNAMGTNLFNKSTHKFTYSKECSISGTATITVSDLSENTTLADITAGATSCTCVVNFSNDLVINSFSGGINYTVNSITVDPVNIENLPEILQESGTEIELTNPQLYLTVVNPFFVNQITATAGLCISSITDGQESTFPTQSLTFGQTTNKKVLSPDDPKDSEFSHQAFPELKNLLTGEGKDGEKKIPETLNIKVDNPILDANNVINFELGDDKGKQITGDWKFYTKLALTDETKISYNKIWDDWGSKDLNGLTVEKATVSFDFKKDVALDAKSIEFFLHGKEGKLYGITNNVKGDANVITIEMTGGPVSNITGGELKVKLIGQGKGINTTQKIEVSNLRMKVDGYYDKEF